MARGLRANIANKQEQWNASPGSGSGQEGGTPVDLEEEIAKGAEADNAAEEWLIKARRVRRLIEQWVREAVSLDGTPAVRAPRGGAGARHGTLRAAAGPHAASHKHPGG